MKKTLFVIALVGLVTLAHATTCDLFSNVNCKNNSYNCLLPISDIGANEQVTDCTFTFTSVDCSNNKGYLSCDLAGVNTECSVSSQSGSTTTWTCTLDTAQINYLNSCVTSGTCDLQVSCLGNWSIGKCEVNYDCGSKPKNVVPDNSWTFALLGVALLSLEVARRKLAPALAKK